MSRTSESMKKAKALAHSMVQTEKEVHVNEMMRATGLSESACREIKRAYHIKDQLPRKKYQQVLKEFDHPKASIISVAEQCDLSQSAVRAVALAEGISMRRRKALAQKKKTKKPQAGEVLRSRVHESLSGDGMSMEWLKYNLGHTNYTGWNYWGCGV